MTITLNVTYEEAQLIRMGICHSYSQARASAKALKGNPLAVYENQQVAGMFQALERKITAAINTEAQKVIDKRRRERA